MKFDTERKIEFKKCFKLDRKFSLKVLTKFGINFIHFARTKVNRMKNDG